MISHMDALSDLDYMHVVRLLKEAGAGDDSSRGSGGNRKPAAPVTGSQRLSAEAANAYQQRRSILLTLRCFNPCILLLSSQAYSTPRLLASPIMYHHFGGAGKEEDRGGNGAGSQVVGYNEKGN